MGHTNFLNIVHTFCFSDWGQIIHENAAFGEFTVLDGRVSHTLFPEYESRLFV